MNCDEFRSAVLAGEEDDATRHHEHTCAACRTRVSDLRASFTALGDAAVWEEPSPELGLQVENLIRTTTSDRAGPDTARSWRPWVIRAAAAAFVVIAAGTVVAANRGAAPDWDVALPATDLAPDAVASVRGWNEDAGTRMVVAIEGLAPAPDGFVYEFWLSNGPVHISAGTFHSPGEIELWSGVPRAQYPRLWITLEPIDEDESPSGYTVLDTGQSNA